MCKISSGSCPGDCQNWSATQRTTQRFGLTSVAERAVLAGGRLDIESTPGTGTALYVHLPLPTVQRDPSMPVAGYPGEPEQN
jgi:signal transduction histidine kinase